MPTAKARDTELARVLPSSTESGAAVAWRNARGEEVYHQLSRVGTDYVPGAEAVRYPDGWSVVRSRRSPNGGTISEFVARGLSEDEARNMAASIPDKFDVGVFDPAAASNELRRRGVPGVKYYDQFSRKPASGTHNFVIFDDSIINILKQTGILLPVTGAALSSLNRYGPAPAAPQR